MSNGFFLPLTLNHLPNRCSYTIYTHWGPFGFSLNKIVSKVVPIQGDELPLLSCFDVGNVVISSFWNKKMIDSVDRFENAQRIGMGGYRPFPRSSALHYFTMIIPLF
jgi:hypothetical protein